jgi:hypothetical protein
VEISPLKSKRLESFRLYYTKRTFSFDANETAPQFTILSLKTFQKLKRLNSVQITFKNMDFLIRVDIYVVSVVPSDFCIGVHVLVLSGPFIFN